MPHPPFYYTVKYLTRPAKSARYPVRFTHPMVNFGLRNDADGLKSELDFLCEIWHNTVMAIAKTHKFPTVLSSRVFPTPEDIVLWDSLTPAEQFLVLEQDEEAGFQSGAAAHECLQDRLARVRNL